MGEMSKANMFVVDRLLTIIDDWQDLIIPRHLKFVNAYYRNNKNLKLAGNEFHFTECDMLFIFWRIQNVLQEEYNKRVEAGTIKNKAYIYRAYDIIPKQKAACSKLILKPVIELNNFRK